MEKLKMAFRNIFRNGKRTFLTAFALAIGVAFSICGVSYFNGALNTISSEGTKISGEVRITANNFEIKEKMLDVSSNIDYEKVKKEVMKYSNVKTAVGRIKFGGLLFKGDAEDVNKEAMGFGIEPDENKIVKFDENIYEGRVLDFKNTNEILIGDKIKKILNLKLGDEVTVMSKTQNGSMTAFNYKVVGFYKMENGRLNQSFYITMKDAWMLLDMEGAVTEYLVYMKNIENAEMLKKEIVKNTKDEYLVKYWKEIGMNGTIANVIPFVQKVVVLLFALLAAAGTINTMMMVVFERQKEIGMMKAMGMQPIEIGTILCMEGTIIGIVGSAVGALIGGALSFYLSFKGIHLGKMTEGLPSGVNLTSVLYPILDYQSVIFAMLTAIVISFIATLIPVLSGINKSPAEILRS